MPRFRSIDVLKKRSDFLAVASTRKKWVTPAFIVQIAPRQDKATLTKIDDGELKAFGLTASKKMVGIAVQRNRARRRLRALAIEILAANGAPCYNYVLIARREALTRNYQEMRHDLETALRRLSVWWEK